MVGKIVSLLLDQGHEVDLHGLVLSQNAVKPVGLLVSF